MIDYEKLHPLVKSRVASGAWILDMNSEREGWFRLVDLGTMRSASFARNVLAQLFGGYRRGLDKIGVPVVSAHVHGFESDEYATHQDLDVAWTYEIQRRRAERSAEFARAAEAAITPEIRLRDRLEVLEAAPQIDARSLAVLCTAATLLLSGAQVDLTTEFSGELRAAYWKTIDALGTLQGPLVALEKST